MCETNTPRHNHNVRTSAIARFAVCVLKQVGEEGGRSGAAITRPGICFGLINKASVGQMEIELYKDLDSGLLIPFVDGILQREMCEFLIYRFYWPSRILVGMKTVDVSSLRNIAYDIKQFLEALFANGFHFTSVTYEQVTRLLDAQQNVHGWGNSTYNTKYLRIREFFEFLTMKGISHAAIFPEKRAATRAGHRDDVGDVHSRYVHHYAQDDGQKRTPIVDDYVGRVISMATYGELYRRLAKIDIVYAVLAQTMMQTCLRVSNACQLPRSRGKLNPHWMLWPEMRATDTEFLKFHHIAKGRKPAWCYIWPETVEAIYRDYISKCFESRKKLFDQSYSVRKNASLRQGQLELPQAGQLLWLTESGVPVKPYMVEEAFRQTGLKVKPHYLRHTGATHLLWNYCRLKGIELDERMAAQFQTFLQFQLGHVSIETTRHYIKTITRKRAEIVVPFALPGNRQQIDEGLPPEAVEEIKMLDFFAGKSETISTNSVSNFLV